MRHKYQIITLAVLLCALLITKAFVQHKENTTYPLQLDFDKVFMDFDDDSIGNSSLNNPKINFAVKDRFNNECSNPLFFLSSDISLGMQKKDFKDKLLTDNAIFIGGNLVPCSIRYRFSEDSMLNAVYVKINPKIYNNAPYYIIEYYGNKRVDLTSDYGINKHIWYYTDYYVYLNDNSGSNVFITVASYKDRPYREIRELAIYGGCLDYDFKDFNPKNSSSKKDTYKYGDSDVYQGSSQQAEDLAAIDEYFGF